MKQDLESPAARDRRVHEASYDPKRRGLSVCLITSLAIADFVDPELTAEGAKRVMPGNVGILTLVAELREQGYEPDVVNLDRLFLEFRRHRAAETPSPGGGTYDIEPQKEPGDLFSFVMQRLRSLSHDVFGFSTICSSYPLTLRLAQQVKRLNPNACVVLGGPQASVVDVSTLEAFDFVDIVVRGEADRTFPLAVDPPPDDPRSYSIILSTHRLHQEIRASVGPPARTGEARTEPQGRPTGARGPGRPPVHRRRTEHGVADRHRAPRGALEPSGGGRTPWPVRRSGPVKLGQFDSVVRSRSASWTHGGAGWRSGCG
jgi:B12 binding domain